LVEPWTLILAATGLFQLFRGAPVDAAFFLVVAGLLIADAAGLLWFAGTGLPRRGLIVVAAILLGLLLVLVPRHGVAAWILVGTAGIGLLALAWSPSAPPRAAPPQLAPARASRVAAGRVAAGRAASGRAASGRHSGLSRSAIAWAAIAVVGCLWELTTFLLGLPSDAAKSEHPSVSILLDPVLDSTGGRIGFIAAWLIVLVWLLRRTGAR
jgi:hypothetical protein